MGNEASMFYPVFCSYASGCFKQRKAEFSIFIDLVNKNALINKFDIHGNILKDGEKVGELVFSTNNTPYKFMVKAPHVLPKMIGQPSMEVSATHNLGQSLEITTNFNKLKSFSVKKTGGNMREVKLNGKLLFREKFPRVTGHSSSRSSSVMDRKWPSLSHGRRMFLMCPMLETMESNLTLLETMSMLTSKLTGTYQTPVLPSLRLKPRVMDPTSESLNSAATLTGHTITTHSKPILLENLALRRDGSLRRESTLLTPKSMLTLTTIK